MSDDCLREFNIKYSIKGLNCFKPFTILNKICFYYMADITSQIISETEINDLKLKLSEKTEAYNELESKYKYLAADLDNIKKNNAKQLEFIRKYQYLDLAKDILDTLDNLERAIKTDPDNNGLLSMYRNLMNTLEKYEITPIYNDGERPMLFNDETDSVITNIATNDKVLNNTVNEVYKRGYLYKDKILRYEEVILFTYVGSNSND